jgi:hypothetical protein
MQNIETIYQQTVLPLPSSEKLRLATIILQSLSHPQLKSQSAFDLLQNIQNDRVFATTQEVDNHLKAERESWDN